jgi:hypothetical protein
MRAQSRVHAAVQQLESFSQTQTSKLGSLQPGVLCAEQQLPTSRTPEPSVPPSCVPPPSVAPPSDGTTPPSRLVTGFCPGEASDGSGAPSASDVFPPSREWIAMLASTPGDPLSTSFVGPLGEAPPAAFPQPASGQAQSNNKVLARCTWAALF